MHIDPHQGPKAISTTYVDDHDKASLFQCLKQDHEDKWEMHLVHNLQYSGKIDCLNLII